MKVISGKKNREILHDARAPHPGQTGGVVLEDSKKLDPVQIQMSLKLEPSQT